MNNGGNHWTMKDIKSLLEKANGKPIRKYNSKLIDDLLIEKEKSEKIVSELNKMKINWEYFWGGGVIQYQEHYYKAIINGIRIEKHVFRSRVEFSIGNMDEAKVKFSTEEDLLKELKNIKVK